MVRIAIGKGRIESLSDLIFGLALSLGSIILIQQPPSDNAALLGQVAEFTLGFLILIGVWRAYTTILSQVEVETSAALDINIFLLLLVALEPYLFNLMWTDWGKVGESASALYALDIGGVMLANAGLLQIAFQQHATRHEWEALAPLRVARVQILSVGSIYLLSALPTFWDWTIGASHTPVRFLLWGIALVGNLVSRNKPTKVLGGLRPKEGPQAPSPGSGDQR